MEKLLHVQAVQAIKIELVKASSQYSLWCIGTTVPMF